MQKNIDLFRQALDNSTLQAAIQDDIDEPLPLSAKSFLTHQHPDLSVSQEESVTEVNAIKLQMRKKELVTPQMEEEDEKEEDLEIPNEEEGDVSISVPPLSGGPSIHLKTCKEQESRLQDRKFYTEKANLRTA